MSDEVLPVGCELLDRIARHSFAAHALVADVVEDKDGICLVADGRAADLTEYNHAECLRFPDDAVGDALQRVTAFFTKRNRTPAIVVDAAARPANLTALLPALGWVRDPAPEQDLMLWDPDSRHIYTAAAVYMTLATNATLSEWLRIASVDMPEPLGEQARTMLTLQFRTPGFTFWFGQHNGLPAGVCTMFVKDGLAQAGPLSILPEYRRFGVGLALLNYVTRQARKDGAAIAYVYNPHNGPATGLCGTAGYHTKAENVRQIWRKEEQL